MTFTAASLSKRSLDLLIAGTLLLVTSPVLIVALVAVASDGASPIYRAPRAGRAGRPFLMLKLRTMVRDADKTGVESTGAGDPRITRTGHFLRKWKIDELPQLWNVLRGEMSVAGPRPNTFTAVARYTDAERALLNVQPGITDLASILFADESEILRGAPDPDEAYYRLIHPQKTTLGLLYVRHASLWLDLRLIALTGLAIVDRTRARRLAGRMAATMSDGALQFDRNLPKPGRPSSGQTH